jgi:hypothetical protein
VDVELIHEGYKYRVQATKSGPNSYFLVMNGSWKEIEVHHMSDGGMITVGPNFRQRKTIMCAAFCCAICKNYEE